MKKSKRIIVLPLALLLGLGVVSCQNKNNNNNTGYDGKEFDISLAQDGSVKASIKKVATNFEITIEGNGEVKSYEKKELVPWNAISKKISKVDVKEGVKNIGDYYFSSSNLDTYYLPSSITKVEKNSFNSGSKVYAYSSSVEGVNLNYSLYQYSETKPTVEDKYWREIGESSVVWKSHKLLFIGNSFTFFPSDVFSVENPGVCSLFSEIGKSLNIDLEVDFVVKGAHTLKKFASASDEMGKIVDEKLKSASDYDYVILQEHSTTPVNDYNSFNSGVSSLVSKIESTQSNCEVYLYSTWGFPSGVSEGSIFSSVSTMEKLLRDKYHACADEHGLKVSDVGESFTYVYENHTNINLYGSDDKHQAYTGAYLSACTHMATILGVDVRESKYYGNLDEATANILQDVAYDISFN
jgi:hypothetical protein